MPGLKKPLPHPFHGHDVAVLELAGGPVGFLGGNFEDKSYQGAKSLSSVEAGKLSEILKHVARDSS